MHTGAWKRGLSFMKGYKLAGVLTIGLGCAMLLSGCSFDSIMDRAVSSVASDTESVVSSSSEDGELVTIKTFDTSLAQPVFDQNLGGTVNAAAGGTVTLQVSASVTDGGTVTYQWYQNNVDSNGGGTKIQGAVDAVYMPDTSEGGTTYYYCVAVNDHGETINESTSATEGVTVWNNMYWQQNADNGGYQYISRDDGSYPTNCSMEVDGVLYSFNDNGFAIDPDTGAYINITTGEVIASGTVEEAAAEESTEEASEEAAEEAAEENTEEVQEAEAVEASSVTAEE